MDKILLHVRVESDDEVLDADILTIFDHGKKMVTNSNDLKVQKVYEHYQNLWHRYVKQRKISDEL